ncbi:MAG TPA: site-2 protease family protein [Acidimicrobiales bacterium]|jgi:Zn-dependent protease|nr:site-2 protease family protein [Acidimicrobiales bacterium]
MKDSIGLGRIAGVRVGLHWSLAAMVVLVAAGLADNRFRYEAPGYSSGTYVIAGILTAVGLLVCVLIHELGHAVVARARGLTVDGITLSWMGGVTRIEGDTGTATNELLVAGVGPVASAAAAGALYVLYIGGSHLGFGPLLLAATGWLAWINVALAAFNILPAAPLDGGRVLHAIVWAAGRNRWKATRVAAGTGVVLGVATILAGLAMADRSQYDLFNGLLIGFVGWWLLASARAELGSGAFQQALDGVKVGDIMRPVAEAPGWITVRAFMEQYGSQRPGWVWLLRDWEGGYAGVVIGDAVAAVPYPHWDLTRPLDVALPIASTSGAAPDESAISVLSRTGGHQVVFVVDGGQTLGAVLPVDVEAMVRLGGRTVAGRRPAQHPAG